MRSDSITFAAANEAADREPRCVIKIEFDTASPYLTSHADIEGVPGDVMYGVVQKPSAISQRIIPDEGRSEIGSFTFTLVDKNEQFTDAMRDQLNNETAGLRRRKVEFYVGYKGMDFSEFQLFQTQIVARCTYRAGSYEIRCSDITRELRKEVFRPNFTTLRDSVSATSLTIPVYDSSGLSLVYHGPAYSDAPNTSVGYGRIEDEVIRFSSKTPDTLYVDGPSGRGCMNTKAVAHAVDSATAQERRTKVEEFIYLEGPGPQLAYAIQTGEIYGTPYTLPENWSLGINVGYVRSGDYVGIGPDLWDPSDDTASLVFRFDGLKQQDGKKFIESQIYLLLGCYSPVYADGSIGLRRMTAVISDASPVVTLTERELIELSALEHEFTLLHNDFRILWAWNPILEAYERETGFFDAESIVAHGESPLVSYEFKGLHSQRATDSTIAVRLDSIRDRYSQPPQSVTATVFGSLNRLEVGDITRIRVPPTILRDFAGPAGDYNRSFEVQQRTYDWVTGDVTLELFGSSARPDSLPTTPPGGATTALPDAWYVSSGTSLDSIIPIAGNLASAGSYTLNGSTTVGSPASIFYWGSDLTIPSGCNITITGNVQLRIRGFLTLNGTINGNGGGKAGVSDPGTTPWETTFSGNAGFIGSSRGWDGIRAISRLSRTPHQLCNTIPAVYTRGQYDMFPLLTLQVVDGDLLGLPTDMRGTGGAPGGRIVTFSESASPPPILAVGGSGAAGGAGLAIIPRGMSFGVSASITLNGGSTTSGALVMSFDVPMYAAAGGPGGPGALLILLDGNNLSIPVVTGKVVCTTGGITQSGNPMKAREATLIASGFQNNPDVTKPPHCGYADPGLVGLWTADSTVPNVVMSALDMSNASHRIQYIPIPQDADQAVDTRPPPPTDLQAGNAYAANFLTWTSPDIGTFDVIDVFASLDNDRTNALKVGETRASTFVHDLPLAGLRFYWIRAKLNPITGRPAVYSEWEPVSPTNGVSSNAEAPGQIDDAPDDFSASGKVNGIQFNWSLPAFKLNGVMRIYEGAAGSNFSSATQVWEDYGFGYFLAKTDTTTRSYWLTLVRGTQESIPEPSPTVGLEAAASSVTSALSAYAYPTSVARSATLGPNPRFVISPPTTVTASGGTPPYTYAWTWLEGGTGITIDYPTFQDTTFSGSNNLDGTTKWGTARCTVTDSALDTAVADVAVQLNWPSVA